ncbi:MAG: folylpolyglutamate synthase/dihydrofolate synthase family protein [Candidatus Nanosalina sp.]
MKYREAVKEITSRHSNRKDPARESTEKSLDLLESPEQDYPVILVGGTNGKGSVVEMTSEILQHLGYRVGTYKSPHLVTPRERIQFNGRKIDQKDFTKHYSDIDRLGTDLSFFEFMTCMAYSYFSEKDVDYALMEVGMGGRLDATNVVDPEVSVITNLGEDHKQHLGETREERAEEKAGIIGSGPVILGEMSEELIEASEKHTDNIKGKKVLDGNANTTLEYEEKEFRIPVRGGFQKENCGIALSVAEELDEIPEDLTSAFEGLKCPGRMEVKGRNPLYIQDGAHNPPAIREIMEDLPEDFTCVFNASKNKEYGKMISTLEEKASKFYFTESNVEWATEKAKSLAEESRIGYEIEENPKEAVRKARKETERDSCVLVTGSLYLIGALREGDENQ